MVQRGVSLEEMQITLEKGWPALDAKKGTEGKIYVLPFNREWEGRYFEEKEVTVYYKFKAGELVLLTVKARYGKDFKRGGVS